MYVARVLQADRIGQVAYAQNIVSYFLTLSVFGLPTHGTREIAKVKDCDDDASKVFTELFTINAITNTIALIIYIILIKTDKNFSDYPLFYATGLLIVFNYFNIDWLYQGKEEYVYIVIRSFIIKVTSFIALFFIVKDREDYVVYALLTSLATGGNYFFNVIHSRKIVKLRFYNLNLKQHIRPLLIIGISIFLNTLYGKIDITMLGRMAPNESVGYYSYAQRIINICITISTSISTVFLPRFTFYYKNHDIDSFNRLINKGISALSFLSIPICVLLFAISSELMVVMFGINFLPASTTIRIFVPLILLKSFGNLLCYQMIICTGKEKHLIPSYVLGTIVNVILNALLIPRLKQNGAAIASVISELSVVLLQSALVRKDVSITFNIKPVCQGLINSLIMIIPVCVARIFMDNNIVIIATSCLICGVIYCILNYLQKNIVFMSAYEKGLNIIKKKKAIKQG